MDQNSLHAYRPFVHAHIESQAWLKGFCLCLPEGQTFSKLLSRPESFPLLQGTRDAVLC